MKIINRTPILENKISKYINNSKNLSNPSNNNSTNLLKHNNSYNDESNSNTIIPSIEENSIILDYLSKVIESKLYNYLILIVSIYSLFIEDFKSLLVSGKYDTVFSIIFLLIFILFIFEISVIVVLDERYICSLFFWIDVVSTISLIMEIHWIMEFINFNKTNAIKQIGRGGRLATRAIRLLRFLRTLKVLTITKYKITINRSNKSNYALL